MRQHRLLIWMKNLKASLKLLNEIGFSTNVASRIEAEKLVEWCLISRKNNHCSLLRIMQTSKNQPVGNIIKLKTFNSETENIDKIAEVCGNSKHNVFSKAFYANTAYTFNDLMYNENSDTMKDNSN